LSRTDEPRSSFPQQGASTTTLTPSGATELNQVGASATIPALTTPDHIDSATALSHNCAPFVTNDFGFRRVPGLPLAILDDVTAI
jgi:hypothetical protein